MMGKKGWIILLVALGVGAALVIGYLGNSQTRAEKQLCTSLDSLQSDVTNLAAIDPSTYTSGTLQTGITTIQDQWKTTVSDAKDVADFDKDNIEDAWSTFQKTVTSIPSGSSPEEIQSTVTSAATTFESSIESTIGDLDCSSS